MRLPVAIAACLVLGLIATASEAPAQSETASSARLVVFDRDAQPNGGLRILRGSPATPRAAAAPAEDAVLGPGRWQAVGGERFWLFDQETGKLAGCRNIGTFNVGEREIECTFGTVSRYRRTFGNNWRH